MNIQTIKEKIRELEGQKSPHLFSIEIAQVKVRTITDQIKILEEIIGIQSAPRTRKERVPKVGRGRNNSAMLEILSSATSPMTANEVRKMWPSDLKPQSIYPTLNDLTKKRQIDRITVARDRGKRSCFAYAIKGRIQSNSA